jgi:hypothetical protein
MLNESLIQSLIPSLTSYDQGTEGDHEQEQEQGMHQEGT